MNDEINYEEIEYEFRKYAALTYATDEMLKNIDEPALAWLTMGGYTEVYENCLRLTWELACRDLLEWKYPLDWIESFKERWFPKWLLSKYPVKYHKFILTEIAGIKRSTIDGYPKRYTIRRMYE